MPAHQQQRVVDADAETHHRRDRRRRGLTSSDPREQRDPGATDGEASRRRPAAGARPRPRSRTSSSRISSAATTPISLAVPLHSTPAVLGHARRPARPAARPPASVPTAASSGSMSPMRSGSVTGTSYRTVEHRGRRSADSPRRRHRADVGEVGQAAAQGLDAAGSTAAPSRSWTIDPGGGVARTPGRCSRSRSVPACGRARVVVPVRRWVGPPKAAASGEAGHARPARAAWSARDG